MTVLGGKDSEPTDPDPCQDKGLTGYGGQIIIQDGLEGADLFVRGKVAVL
jgi:hypothetical protein